MALQKGKILLNREEILSRVTQLEIFEAFCPERFVLGRTFKSPLRNDKHSGNFFINQKQGSVFFIDYGNGDRGDAFEFVKQITQSTSFPEVLEAIDAKMGLGLLQGNPKEVSIRKIEVEDEIEEEKLIQVQIKPFTEKELVYWSEYGLNHEDLKRQKDVKVYSVKKYWIDKQLRFINYGDLCFAYHFTMVDKIKLYHPLADKNKGEIKWISNVKLDTMYGFDNIRNCQKAIITKSVKDLLVLSKVFPCVIGSQNESLASISQENLAYIKENVKEIYYSADSDEPGKNASFAITETLGLKHLNSPDYLLEYGVNDWAGWSKRDSLAAIAYFLKLKGIYVPEN